MEALDFSYNLISEINSLEQLTNLTYLRLSSNQISEIKGLDQLSNLKKLILHSNQLSKIKGLDRLTNLTYLNLHSNQLIEIQGLEQLIALNDLNLSSNQINEIKGLEQLTALYNLNLDANQLSEIKGLEQLTALNTLSLSSSKISEIKGLEQLTNLNKLWLHSNQIREIKGLEQLAKLNTLYIHYNQISEIKGLEQLKQLSFLNLQNNTIEDLSKAKSYLKANNLTVVWKDKFYPFTNNGIDLSGNPIKNPPVEILNQGKQAILNWISANKKELNEIKVILIGEPKAGKTSLLNRLKYNAFNPDEKLTDGINIESIVFGKSEQFKNQELLADITAYFWDFGGQEIMSATHQFFLTKRAVYVLVLDARIDKDSSDNIRKWIKQIEATGGHSSIIIVANQIDVNQGFGFKNESDLADEFPQIKYFLKTSCIDGEEETMEELKRALEDLIPKADMFKTEVDERWFPIKEQLQKDTKAKHYIDETSFIEICNDHDLTDKNEQESLIRFLHDLGIVLNFDKALDKKNDNLKEYFVLDPYWITYGVYQILTSTYAAKQNGIVAMDKLEYIINEEVDKKKFKKEVKKNTPEVLEERKIKYSTNQRKFLLEILREFKLCFVKDNSHFILPDLLDTKEPKEASTIFKNNLNKFSFIYQYEYLPKSVLPHIMVETDKYLTKYWRSGCLIVGNNCKALIKDYSNKITIVINGDTIKKTGLLAVIRHLVETINRKQGLHAKRLIPLPETNIQMDYDELADRFNGGENTYKIYKPKKIEYLISELLVGIPTLNKTTGFEILKRKPKLFVSYARKDILFLADFNVHMADLKRNGLIEQWTDQQINPGEEWEDALKRALETADIILFLVSPDFIASDYIQEIEVKKAMERHQEGDVIIVPVIIRPCDFSCLSISKFQALPPNAKPISSWENKDEAWLEVLHGIKKILKGFEATFEKRNLHHKLNEVLGG